MRSSDRAKREAREYERSCRAAAIEQGSIAPADFPTAPSYNIWHGHKFFEAADPGMVNTMNFYTNANCLKDKNAYEYRALFTRVSDDIDERKTGMKIPGLQADIFLRTNNIVPSQEAVVRSYWFHPTNRNPSKRVLFPRLLQISPGARIAKAPGVEFGYVNGEVTLDPQMRIIVKKLLQDERILRAILDRCKAKGRRIESIQEAVSYTLVASRGMPVKDGRRQPDAYCIGDYITQNRVALPLLYELHEHGAVLYMCNSSLSCGLGYGETLQENPRAARAAVTRVNQECRSIEKSIGELPEEVRCHMMARLAGIGNVMRAVAARLGRDASGMDDVFGPSCKAGSAAEAEFDSDDEFSFEAGVPSMMATHNSMSTPNQVPETATIQPGVQGASYEGQRSSMYQRAALEPSKKTLEPAFIVGHTAPVATAKLPVVGSARGPDRKHVLPLRGAETAPSAHTSYPASPPAAESLSCTSLLLLAARNAGGASTAVGAGINASSAIQQGSEAPSSFAFDGAYAAMQDQIAREINVLGAKISEMQAADVGDGASKVEYLAKLRYFQMRRADCKKSLEELTQVSALFKRKT